MTKEAKVPTPETCDCDSHMDPENGNHYGDCPVSLAAPVPTPGASEAVERANGWRHRATPAPEDAEALLREAEKVLRQVEGSAFPTERENPAMWRAWSRMNAFLAALAARRSRG